MVQTAAPFCYCRFFGIYAVGRWRWFSCAGCGKGWCGAVNNFSFAAWLRLLLLYAKMDFRWLLHDRLFAVISVSADILSNLAAVSGVYMLAARFSQIGGMTREEIFFMLSYTTLLTGVYQMFFAANNVGHISRRIGRGQVEHMLLQPVPLPVQLLCEGFNPFPAQAIFGWACF